MKSATKNRKLKLKKAISLSTVIEKNLKDASFAKLYQKEQLINSIAKMILELRKATGMTQAELAKKVKTTQPAIARLESGRDKRVPSLELLMRIASAAGARLNLRFQII